MGQHDSDMCTVAIWYISRRSGSGRVVSLLYLGSGHPLHELLLQNYSGIIKTSNVMANNAAAAIMFPIAASTAEEQGMDIKQVWDIP